MCEEDEERFALSECLLRLSGGLKELKFEIVRTLTKEEEHIVEIKEEDIASHLAQLPLSTSESAAFLRVGLRNKQG